MDVRENYSGAFKSACCLLFVACAMSFVPGFGFAMWFIAAPVLFVAFILSIVVLARGGALPGVLLLGATLVVAPGIMLVAPVLTTGLAAAVVSSAVEPTPTPAPRAPVVPRATRVVPNDPAAKRAALQLYPDLGREGSPLNVAFLEKVKKAQTVRPAIFDRPDWPSFLAAEADAELRR